MDVEHKRAALARYDEELEERKAAEREEREFQMALLAAFTVATKTEAGCRAALALERKHRSRGLPNNVRELEGAMTRQGYVIRRPRT